MADISEFVIYAKCSEEVQKKLWTSQQTQNDRKAEIESNAIQNRTLLVQAHEVQACWE